MSEYTAQTFLDRTLQPLLIDGELTPAAENATYTVYEPATREPLAQVAQAGPPDVERAVSAARRAFEQGPWARMTAAQRGEVLLRMADLVAERLAAIAEVETRNVGKPYFLAADDVETVAGCFRFYGGAALTWRGDAPAVNANFVSYIERVPVGVCVGIVPWNFPAQISGWKIGPALAAGNCLILKPATYTPLSALMLAEIGLEAGLPPGVLQVLPGPGSTVGSALVAHAGVDKVAFTGETATGITVMQQAATTLKRVTMELGGKSPSLIFADADLEQAVRGSLTSIYFNAGQMCAARSRLLVERSVYQAFIDTFVERARKLRLGNPMESTTHVGPMISDRQVDTVEEYVAVGRAEGASLLLGGTRPTETHLQQGCFYRPTVFADVKNTMRIAQEEIFGPVVSIIPFDSEEEGVRLANQTSYGLAATVWTEHVKRAHRVARQIRAGGVWVNSNMTLFNETPFGGFKGSGLGRELGLEALEAYTEPRHIAIYTAPTVRSFNLDDTDT